ncbi:MAG TPA: hypothetical protein PKE25_02920, partial [Novosphingobium sp.]|nr:hypothetical protein [Novosphingobium sp.]
MATFEGTPGNDTLEGTEGNDIITGAAGNDSLSGLGGDDIIFGGLGNDTMRGGEGNDTFVSDVQVQNEVFDGGPGTDTLELRFGSFQVTFAAGPTAIHALNTSQFSSVERLVFASQAGEFIQAQLTVPQVVGGGFTEIVGGSGFDNLILLLVPGSTKPSLTFTGFDAAPANAWDGLPDRITLVTTTSATLSAYAGLNALQVLVGSAGNDTLIGSDNADVLNGGAGVNVLQGGGGNDHLVLINSAAPNPQAGGFNPPSFLTGEGSLFDGGDGFDLLGIGGLVFFQGTLQ